MVESILPRSSGGARTSEADPIGRNAYFNISYGVGDYKYGVGDYKHFRPTRKTAARPAGLPPRNAFPSRGRCHPPFSREADDG